MRRTSIVFIAVMFTAFSTAPVISQTDIATLLLATLVDEGKLDWNRPVTNYMSDWKGRFQLAVDDEWSLGR
jgi:hypothetical protein